MHKSHYHTVAELIVIYAALVIDGFHSIAVGAVSSAFLFPAEQSSVGMISFFVE